jgi:hypothetical protein
LGALSLPFQRAGRSGLSPPIGGHEPQRPRPRGAGRSVVLPLSGDRGRNPSTSRRAPLRAGIAPRRLKKHPQRQSPGTARDGLAVESAPSPLLPSRALAPGLGRLNRHAEGSPELSLCRRNGRRPVQALRRQWPIHGAVAGLLEQRLLLRSLWTRRDHLLLHDLADVRQQRVNDQLLARPDVHRNHRCRLPADGPPRIALVVEHDPQGRCSRGDLDVHAIHQ